MNTAPYNDPNDSPDSRAQKVNAIWRAVAALYVLVMIGMVFYWEMNDAGLPILICELQAQVLNGSCYIALNVLLSILAFLVPVFIVKFIVEKITGVKIETAKK